MYRRTRQNGFGSASTIVVVLVMACIGIAAGLMVRTSRHTASPQSKTSTPTITAPISTAVPYTPPGYTRYSDNATGFSVAYPNGWGGLQAFGQKDTSGLTRLSTAALQPGQLDAVAGEQDVFMVALSASGKVALRYEDGILMPTAASGVYTWHMTNSSSLREGATVDLPLYKNQGGVSYYDASTAGEDGTDCSDHNYVFVSRRGLVLVGVPRLCPLQTGGYIDKAAKAAYVRQLKTIIDSVSLF